MMDYIDLYHYLFIIFMVVTIALLAASVAVFIILKIPKVIGDLLGINAKKEIAALQEASANANAVERPGALDVANVSIESHDSGSDGLNDQTTKTFIGRNKDNEAATDTITADPMDGRKSQSGDAVSAQPVEADEWQDDTETQETGSEEETEETDNTTALDDSETTTLDVDGTMQLSDEPNNWDGDDPDDGGTTVLTETEPEESAEVIDVHFFVFDEMMMIHTDETIS